MPGFTELKPESRGIASRSDGFNRASLATTMRGVPEELRGKAVEITAQGERVRGRMREVFAKHREKWQSNTYRRLLAEEGNERAPRPDFAAPVDTATRLQAKAQRLVEGRQARRLARVTQAEVKQVRQLLPYGQQFARSAKRGVGLGE